VSLRSAVKRFCPYCGFDQFGKIIADDAPGGRRGRMTCEECGESFESGRLQELSRKPTWWYWLVLPLALLPVGVTLVAPMIDRLIPNRHLEAGLTFWALATSPAYLYVFSGWVFATHRLARWYFGAIPASLVLTVLNLLLAGMLWILRA